MRKRVDPDGDDWTGRDGWREQGLLAISADDQRLSWPERELIRQIGERLYGSNQQQREANRG